MSTNESATTVGDKFWQLEAGNKDENFLAGMNQRAGGRNQAAMLAVAQLRA